MNKILFRTAGAIFSAALYSIMLTACNTQCNPITKTIAVSQADSARLVYAGHETIVFTRAGTADTLRYNGQGYQDDQSHLELGSSHCDGVEIYEDKKSVWFTNASGNYIQSGVFEDAQKGAYLFVTSSYSNTMYTMPMAKLGAAADMDTISINGRGYNNIYRLTSSAGSGYVLYNLTSGILALHDKTLELDVLK